MNRILIALLLILVAVPAAAQSRTESFTTRYSSQYDAYTHETAYEFEVQRMGSNSYQVASAPELIVDIYYNTRRVWLLDGAIQCESSGGSWTTWASLSSDTHMATIRSTVYPATDQCRIKMVFFNRDSDTGAQRATLRVNVASTTGGFMRLSKVPSWQLFSGGEGSSALTSTESLDRIADRNAALAKQ